LDPHRDAPPQAQPTGGAEQQPTDRSQQCGDPDNPSPNLRLATDYFERGLHSVLDNIREYAIFMLDCDRNIVGWNNGAERILGYTAAEVLGRSGDIVFTPEDRATGQPVLEQEKAEREGRAEDERWHVRKDGSRFYASGVLNGVYDPAGPLVVYVKVMQDFTERRKAADALARSEQRYRMLLDGIKDHMIFMLDLSGRIVSWSAAATRITGYTEQEAIGQPLGMLFTETDRADGVPEREIARALVEGRVEAVGWRVRKDGSLFWGEEVAAPIHDSAGHVQGISKITRDITERMLAEQEQARLLRQMTEANRIKDEFLGTVSHELRTPLNSVLGWTRLLRNRALDDDARERALEAVERNAQTQAHLIEDLLDVSRIVSGQLRLELRSVSVPDVISAALEAVRPAAEAREIQLLVSLAPDADQVVADSQRLQQIVWNLVANAIKFTSAGGQVTVTTEMDGSDIHIVVSDTGVGIAPEFLPFVFERFRQADSTTTRSQAGLGLGLAIVRHLVELHGGTATAESAGLGKGATFRIAIPRRRSVTGALLPRSVESSSVEQENPSVPDPDVSNLKIVVVEDDDDTRALLTFALGDRDADVTAAPSAAAGLEAVRTVRPDVVIADIGMPGNDGYWLIKQIRGDVDPSVKTVPAIALTAYARPSDRSRAISSGYQSHIAKPVDLATLYERVAALAGPRRND